MGNKRKGIAELINEVKEYIPDALINDELAILIIDFLLKDFKIYHLRNMACSNHNLHTILLFPNVFIFSALPALVWVMIIPLEAERVPHNERVLPS